MKQLASEQLLRKLSKPGAKSVMKPTWKQLIKTAWTEEIQTRHTEIENHIQYKSKGQQDTNDHP